MNVKIVTLISFVLLGCVSTPVDESKLETSRELVEVMLAVSGEQEAIDALVPEMLASIVEDNPDFTESEIQQITELVTEEMNQLIPDVLEHTAQLYAENFFTNELEELLVILKTRDPNSVWPPQQIRLLQKFNSTVPRINTRLASYARSLGDQASDRLIAKLERDADR